MLKRMNILSIAFLCVSLMNGANRLSHGEPEKGRRSQALICIEQPHQGQENKTVLDTDYKGLAPLPLTYLGQVRFPRSFMEWHHRQQYPLEPCLTSASDDWADVYLQFMQDRSSMDVLSAAITRTTLLRKLEGKETCLLDITEELGQKGLRTARLALLPCYEIARRLLERRTGKCFVITDGKKDYGSGTRRKRLHKQPEQIAWHTDADSRDSTPPRADSGALPHESYIDENTSCDEGRNQPAQDRKCVIL